MHVAPLTLPALRDLEFSYTFIQVYHLNSFLLIKLEENRKIHHKSRQSLYEIGRGFSILYIML